MPKTKPKLSLAKKPSARPRGLTVPQALQDVACGLEEIADAIRGHRGDIVSGTVLSLDIAAQKPTARFTKLSAHEVRDNTTGLVWHAETTARDVNHLKAAKACEALRAGGHSDWRLPTVEELRALVDYTRHSPAIDTAFFKDTDSRGYWTNTALAADSAYAWVVSFYYGNVSGVHRDGAFPARAVRGPVSVPGQ